jgi:hypothetical protein
MDAAAIAAKDLVAVELTYVFMDRFSRRLQAAQSQRLNADG